jgi:hypothetical protein
VGIHNAERNSSLSLHYIQRYLTLLKHTHTHTHERTNARAHTHTHMYVHT